MAGAFNTHFLVKSLLEETTGKTLGVDGRIILELNLGK